MLLPPDEYRCLFPFNKDFPWNALRLELSCKKAGIVFTNKNLQRTVQGKAHPKKYFRERLVREVGMRLPLLRKCQLIAVLKRHYVSHF
jgi:hypothetical protein